MASPENTALATGLKELVGNLFAMYIRAHGAHWNVESAFFGPLHDFFGTIYSDVFGSIDPFAEQLRFIQFYAPYTLGQMSQLSTIPDTSLPDGNPVPLIADLLSVNALVLQSLYKVRPLAEASQNFGLTNFIDERIDMHNKHAWQLRSHLKKF